MPYRQGVRNPNGSLWLEHVSDRKEAGANYYWFMWYDPNGWPTIPASSIFARENMANMQRLRQFYSAAVVHLRRRQCRAQNVVLLM
jgi:hypothetical protein